MARVHAHKGKAVKPQLTHMRIEKAANGVTVHKGYSHGRDQHGGHIYAPDEKPSVFTKHAAALKHVKAGLAEMHGEPDDDEMGNNATAALKHVKAGLAEMHGEPDDDEM